MKLFYFVLITVVLSGCSGFWSKAKPVTPDIELQNAINEIKYSQDDFTKIKTLESNYDARSDIKYFLRAVNASESEPYRLASQKNKLLPKWNFQIYVYTSTLGWAFIDKAFDSDGRSLGFTQIDRIVRDRGMVQEHAVLSIDKQYLERKVDTGIKVKIIGQRRDFQIEIEPFTIKAFLGKFKLVEGE